MGFIIIKTILRHYRLLQIQTSFRKYSVIDLNQNYGHLYFYDKNKLFKRHLANLKETFLCFANAEPISRNLRAKGTLLSLVLNLVLPSEFQMIFFYCLEMLTIMNSALYVSVMYCFHLFHFPKL